jgi:hypothetical protein
MARYGDGIIIITGPEFRLVADALREIDDTFPGKLRAAMRRSATPIIQDVRMAALALPARRAKHTGLRARLAAGVGVQVGVGGNARMRFITKMPPGQEELPRGEDSGLRGWRHPVYGHDVWVHQRGGSWFRETIADQRPDIERRLQDVLDQAAEQIQRAGRA